MGLAITFYYLYTGTVGAGIPGAGEGLEGQGRDWRGGGGTGRAGEGLEEWGKDWSGREGIEEAE